MKTKSVRLWLPDDNIMIFTLGIVITIIVVTNIITKTIITVIIILIIVIVITIIIIIIIHVLIMINNNNIMDCKNGDKGKNRTVLEKCAVWNG